MPNPNISIGEIVKALRQIAYNTEQAAIEMKTSYEDILIDTMDAMDDLKTKMEAP